jgi:streptogramin lyase
VPNYAAWGPDGALYVTDYEGATIWRVGRGGGAAQPWLKDDQLNGGPFGTTGIVLSADRRSFLVGQQSEAGGAAGNPATGRILRVSIGTDGKPAGIRQLWESGPADGPDGFAVAKSGAIYVALLVANQIAVLGPDGSERERFPSQPYSGDNGSSVPFDSPSSVRFLGTDVVVANQSYFQGSLAHQAILAVATGEAGQPEYIPPAATPKKKRRRRSSAGRGAARASASGGSPGGSRGRAAA